MRRLLRTTVAALVALALLLAGAGFTDAEPISSDAVQQLAEDLPLLPPDLIYT